MNRTMNIWLSRAAVIALAAAAGAACGKDDPSGPSTDLDPTQTQAALEQAVNQYFTGNQGLMSLGTFSSAIGQALPSVAPVLIDLAPANPSVHDFVPRIRASMSAVYERSGAQPGLMAEIPPELYGTCFEYDPVSGYVPSDCTGAPDDGVRFILYDDISTLNPIGYVDLVDKSNLDITPATVDITFQVFLTGDPVDVEVVHYRISGSVSETGGTLNITGFLSDGQESLTFGFLVSGSDAIGFDADLNLAAGDLSITLEVSEDPTGGGITEASIANGNDEILFIVSVDSNGDVLGGSGIFFNDVLVATFVGNVAQEVTVQNTQGEPLTNQQLVAVAQIFVALEEAVAIIGEMFALGLGLVGVIFFF